MNGFYVTENLYLAQKYINFFESENRDEGKVLTMKLSEGRTCYYTLMSYYISKLKSKSGQFEKLGSDEMFNEFTQLKEFLDENDKLQSSGWFWFKEILLSSPCTIAVLFDYDYMEDYQNYYRVNNLHDMKIVFDRSKITVDESSVKRFIKGSEKEKKDSGEAWEEK